MLWYGCETENVGAKLLEDPMDPAACQSTGEGRNGNGTEQPNLLPTASSPYSISLSMTLVRHPPSKTSKSGELYNL